MASMASKFLLQYAPGIGATISAVGSMVVYVQHSMLALPYYKNFYQFYEHGFPKKMDPDLNQMAEDVLESLNWSVNCAAQVEFFLASANDTLYKGSVSSKGGVLIGIPVNFLCKTRDDISILQQSKMKLFNKEIDWYSDEGEKFQDSLILSKSAQKFSIARDLFYSNTQYVIFEAVLTGITILSAFNLSYFGNRMLGIYRLKFPFRWAFYSFVTGFCALGYFMLKDSYACHLDKKVDSKAAKLGKEYAEGGVELYNKMIARNLAIRNLNEELGPKYFTAYGNNRRFWRTPHLLLTQRRDLLQNFIKENFS